MSESISMSADSSTTVGAKETKGVNPAADKKNIEIPVISVSEQKSTIQLDAEFTSFLQLRDAIETYQREKCIQLIVKDSKLLEAESTRKVRVWCFSP